MIFHCLMLFFIELCTCILFYITKLSLIVRTFGKNVIFANIFITFGAKF